MSTIEVRDVYTTRTKINGVTVSHDYYNASEKEIKYITFSYVPYNAVNDTVVCTASGECEVSGELTGPIPPKHKSSVEWESMWFNPTVTRAEITQIHIQYMDNTEEVIEGKDIMDMNDHQSTYYNEIGKKQEEESKKIAEEYKKEEEERKKKEAEEFAKAEKREKIANIRNTIIGLAILAAVIIWCVKEYLL